MRKLTLFVTLLALLLGSVVVGQPLKAMLYCYLPAVDKAEPMPEYNKLAAIINKKLQKANISVVVDVCDPHGNGNDLYNQTAIDSLFDDHDILEVDVSYIWAIQTPLLQFSRDEIQHYDKVYPFEWQPTTRKSQGKEVIVGSPGLLCSDFLETRSNGNFKDRLYADYSVGQSYALVSYYMSAFINGGANRTLDDVDYTKLDYVALGKVAQFLKNCQTNKSSFNYGQNWCLNYQSTSKPFFDTQYATTVGYSENLYNFQKANIPTKDITIEHITKTWPKKVFYEDSFVTKATVTDRETVLKFYEFMLTDDVLDVYIKGQYTKRPMTTYLLPPTIKYFENLVKNDVLYAEIYKTAFLNAEQFPISQKGFSKNVGNLAVLINNALQQINGSNDL